MKKPFEHYITLIENVLEFKLFSWQKDVLLQIYSGNLGSICFGRQGGITMLTTAALIMCEEMDRDTGNLPPRLYELDGYTADVVTCDDDWKNIIEWVKEN